MLKNLLKFFKDKLGVFIYFLSEFRHELFFSVALSFLVGLFDGLGLAIFIPLLEIISNSGTTNSVSDSSINAVMERFDFELTLNNVLCVMVIVFIVKGIAKFASSAYQVVVFQRFTRKLRLSLHSSFNRITFAYFTKTDIGRVQNTFTSEVMNVSNAARFYLKGIESIVLLLTYLVLALISNAEFTVLVVMSGILTNVIYRYINRKTKLISSALVSRNNTYQGMLIQYINTFKYLKATGRIGPIGLKLNAQVKDIEKGNRKIGIMTALSLSLREPIMMIVLAITIFIQVVVLNGSLELILLSILFFYRALQSVLSFQNHYNNFLSLHGSLVNVREFQIELQKNKESIGTQKFTEMKGGIYLQDVGFSYGQNKVLNNINLTIEKNECIALVGKSGSGKSTLINILTGLLPTQSGSIKIDGIELKELDRLSYQQHLGYITQEPVVFTETLFNNVTFFEEKNEDNLVKFFDAITKAGLLNFVNQNKFREEIFIENNGINLSGGQRQRILIAREFYKDSHFMFFDEATSALDYETERLVQESIKKMIGSKTIVVAAHRLSTLKDADRLIILDEGSIRASGTFDELRESDKGFRELIALQNI